LVLFMHAGGQGPCGSDCAFAIPGRFVHALPGRFVHALPDSFVSGFIKCIPLYI